MGFLCAKMGFLRRLFCAQMGVQMVNIQ